ncbi:MAG: UDP-N-acetylmuramoyl-tripeptide--D-alanyl-D-alanine ligase, partial [Solibacillus sp.]
DYALKLGIKADVYSFNNGILAYYLLKDLVDQNSVILIKGDMYSKTMFELASNLKNKEWNPPHF